MRNYIIRPSAQTIVNKNNLICLSSHISESPAQTVNVDIQCINVRSMKNKATSVADLVILSFTPRHDLLRSAVVEWLSFINLACKLKLC